MTNGNLDEKEDLRRVNEIGEYAVISLSDFLRGRKGIVYVLGEGHYRRILSSPYHGHGGKMALRFISKSPQGYLPDVPGIKPFITKKSREKTVIGFIPAGDIALDEITELGMEVLADGEEVGLLSGQKTPRISIYYPVREE